MAEALVALDRVADAISHLSPDTLTTADIITVPPEVKADPGMLSCFCMLNCAIHRSYETAKEKKYKKRRNKNILHQLNQKSSDPVFSHYLMFDLGIFAFIVTNWSCLSY